MTVGTQLKGTLAGLRSIRGTIGIYAGQTQLEDSRAAYDAAIKELDSIIDCLEDRLRKLELEEPQYQGS